MRIRIIMIMAMAMMMVRLMTMMMMMMMIALMMVRMINLLTGTQGDLTSRMSTSVAPSATVAM